MGLEAAPWSNTATYSRTSSNISSTGKSRIDLWRVLDIARHPSDLRCLTYDQHLGEGAEFTVDLYRFEPDDITVFKTRFPAVVALKTAKVSTYDFREKDVGGQNDLHRFIHEIRILTHHTIAESPYIINMYSAVWKVEANRLPIPRLAVEYSPMGDLAQYLRKSDPLSLFTKLQFVHDVCAGLETIHYCGIIHGDVKLPNVMVFPADNDTGVVAKLSDFGCAVSSMELERAEKYRGTRRYSPPETQESGYLSEEELMKCDVFTLGLAIWEIMGDGKPYYIDDEVTDVKRYHNTWQPTNYTLAFDKFISGYITRRYSNAFDMGLHQKQTPGGLGIETSAILGIRRTVHAMLKPPLSRCTSAAALDMIYAV
jgi:serine/threonine protein kinase